MVHTFWRTAAVAAATLLFASDFGPVMAAGGPYKSVQEARIDCEKLIGDDFDLVIDGCTFLIESDGPADAEKADALGRRSLANHYLRRYRRAADDMRRAVELQPNDRARHVALARALARVADHDGTARAYEKALALPPMDDDPGNATDQSIRFQMIVWLCTIGDVDKAMAAYRDLGDEDGRMAFIFEVRSARLEDDPEVPMTDSELRAYFATGCHDQVYQMFAQELPAR